MGRVPGLPPGHAVPDPPGADIVLEIDVGGAEQIKAGYPDALYLRGRAAARGQEDRLRGRGDPEDKIRKRLAKAAEERRVGPASWAMHVVVNDDLDRAVAEIEGLIAEAAGPLA